MQHIKVITSKQLLNGINSGRKNAIIKFKREGCVSCKKLATCIQEKAHLDIDIYEIEEPESKTLGWIFEVTMLPTAIFVQDGVSIIRMDGSKETDQFIEIVNDIVDKNCTIVEWK